MNFENSQKITTAIMLASSVCLTTAQFVSATPPPKNSPDVSGVARPPSAATTAQWHPGLPFTNFSPDFTSGYFSLTVPASNPPGTNQKYAGLNIPPLGAGLATFAINNGGPCSPSPTTPPLGILDFTNIYYLSPSGQSAGLGLRLMVQDTKKGLYHISNTTAGTFVQGSSHFDMFTSSVSNFTPTFGSGFGTGFQSNINKAAILFTGGATNDIWVYSFDFGGHLPAPSSKFTATSGFGTFCNANSGYSASSIVSGFDQHFNFEFNQLNTVS